MSSSRCYKTGMHNSWVRSGPPNVLYLALRADKKYRKLLPNDRDFMNEFKLYSAINSFGNYYNPTQLRWQQYQTTRSKKSSYIQLCCWFFILDSTKVQIVSLTSAFESN